MTGKIFSLQDLNTRCMFLKLCFKKKTYAPLWQFPNTGGWSQPVLPGTEEASQEVPAARREVRPQKMQSPNNPLKTKEASEFPLEVLRIGPAKRGTKGRETTAKAFGGKLKQLSGMILGGKPPAAKVARP